MKKIYLTLALVLLVGCSFIFAQTVTFNYTGAVQTYTVPCGVTQLTVDVKGAQGEGNTNGVLLGGLGGRITGTMTVVPCQVLDIYVGGGGVVSNPGGFNGGGNGGLSYQDWPQWSPSPACPGADGGGGGGGSDIRNAPYGLANRLVVGGGGGGTGGDRIVNCGPGAGGGGGGGYYGGGGGGGYSGLPGTGGSQVAGGIAGTSPGCAIFGGLAGFNGALGIGGVGGGAPGNNQFGSAPGCTGGAGGTLTGATGINCTGGGCPGTWSGGSGGGGSNFAGTLTGVVQTQGFQSGNGQIIITPVGGGCLPLVATPTFVNPTCGNSNGSITIGVTGGTAPYTYSWAPNVSSSSNATGLSAGTYVITVTDGCGDITTVTVVLTSTSLTVAANVTANEPCNGNCVGSISTTITGGVGPFTYSWSPTGGTGATASGLCANTYTVTVTDHNGCVGTASVTITQPLALTATIGAPTNIKCNGGNNGSATVTVTGGTLAYTYSWTTLPIQTSPTATGLTAGTYTVTVTDANGCTATASVTITQPVAPLSATTSTVPATCGQFNGSATANPAGGTGPYTYSWNPTTQTGQTATGLSAASYTVTITDANGCSLTAAVTVPSLSGETVTICGPTVNVSCNGGNNGSTVSCPAGGTAPYTYSWSTFPVQTNASATGLTAGTYTITVTDANGCTATASVTITQPLALIASIAPPVNVLCNGGNNGSDLASATGGTGAYTYSWNTFPVQNNANATGLTAGSYTVTVTDANGCTSTASVTITQPIALVASTGPPVNELCNGGNNGSDLASATGGTGAYTYSWNTFPVQNNANATGLTAGSYTVTITDANGCISTASVTITQPIALTATTTTVFSHCGKADGSATANPAGGTGAYTYSWNSLPIQTTQTATNLSAGTYTVTVTDANGCIFTTTATVNNQVGETVTINPPVNVLCNGGNNASATANVTGGTAPYTYSWTTLPVQTGVTATGLTAGSYTVNVTDANGCIASASVTITQPTVLTASTGPPANVLCNGNNNGSDIASAAGGVGPYAYLWNTFPVQNNANAVGLSAGSYTVTVTDANGCTATAKVTITQPTALTLTAAAFPTTCNGGSDGQATAIPAGGVNPYTYAWSNGNTSPNDNGLPAGNYVITVTDANGCTQSATVAVTQPPPITVSFSADSVNGCVPVCANFKDLSVDPNGVITKWNWSFGDGGTDTNKNPRHCYTAPGPYKVTLTVTDNHGCTFSSSVPNMITVYSFPVAAFTISPSIASIMSPVIQFTDQSTDPYGIASWLWEFNDPLDSLTSNMESPSHSYKDTGTHCATLVVTNIHGCIDSTTQCVVITPEYTLYIPNAFSPNGDGIDDIFQPRGEFVKEYKMYIYDRWGMRLFYTDDFTKGWNGGINGSSRLCQEDTYVYLIEITDSLGKKHKYLGRVTLIQ